MKEILRLHIHSVTQLETLLLLRRYPHREWRAHEVSRDQCINTVAAADQLAGLCRSGLLCCRTDPTGHLAYRYDSRECAIDQQVAELAAAYAEKRVRVINYLYSTPADSVRSFAAAFRIKQEKEE